MQLTLALSSSFFLDWDDLYTRDLRNSSGVNNPSIRINPKEYPSLVDIAITPDSLRICLCISEVTGKLFMLLLQFWSSSKILSVSSWSCSCRFSNCWRQCSICVKCIATYGSHVLGMYLIWEWLKPGAGAGILA